jgi:FAD/FMN-containing dehydrogenase
MSSVDGVSHAAYEARKQRVSESVQARLQQSAAGESFALGGKKSSNLFRVRRQGSTSKIDVHDFIHVLSIDPVALTAEVEGMCTYEAFVDETLKFGCLPTVVPELKSITVGGAVTGIGIESSSFKLGLVHETVLEMDILLGTGEVITATPTNEYKDLFFGFPNSYGTLGYALRLKVKLIKAKAFVKIERRTFEDSQKFFDEMGQVCLAARRDGSIDFVDGALLNGKLYLITGTFVDAAPYASDYTYLNIYYKTLPTKAEDYVTARQYIWRWDTDWFWCSRFFGFENRFVRMLFGRKRLRSTTYWKIREFFEGRGIVKLLEPVRGRSEPVIQDVEIPLERSADFFDFFQREIGIKYVWMCPTMAFDPSVHFDLYAMDPSVLYINFGFWDGVKSTAEDGHYNRLIEKYVEKLKGKKSLYSTSYYSSEEFWSLYNKQRYDELKCRYDPQRALKDLYQKCVQRT